MGPAPRLLLALALFSAGCSPEAGPAPAPEAPQPAPAPPPLPQPDGLVALAGDGQVTLRWNPVADAHHTDVYAGTDAAALAAVGVASAGATTLIVSGLPNGIEQHFAIELVSAEGVRSPRSAQVTATPFHPDLEPPRVSGSTPTAGEHGVSASTGIGIRFDEPMDVGSVSVAISPPVDLGTPAWNDVGTEVAYVPAAVLAYETSYTVIVDGADLAGNGLETTVFAFATATAPDTTPPALVATTPPAAETRVPVQTPIQLVFSEGVDRASVEAALSSAPAIGCASWSWASDTLATCTPAAPLAESTAYTVTLGTGARDLAGNPLETPAAFAFATSGQHDSTRPTVKAVSPAPGAAGEPRSATVSVTFSEAVEKVSAQAAFAVVSPARNTEGTFAWSADGRTVTFDPGVDFGFGDQVSWRVSTAVADLAGNAMQRVVEGAFGIARQGTAMLYGEGALDGDVLSGSALCADCGTIRVGEYPGGHASRGFLSFDLSQLPATTVRISDATLYVTQSAVSGSPYELGALLAQSVAYGTSLTAEAFDTPVLTFTGQRCSVDPLTLLVRCEYGTWNDEHTLSTTPGAGWKSVSVGGKVARDWEARAAREGRSQFRLRFEREADYDYHTEYATLVPGEGASNQPYLVVKYEYP